LARAWREDTAMGPKLTSGTFYGEIVRSQRIGGFILSESTYGPDLRIPAHSHENPFLYFVLQGASTELYQQKTRWAESSMLVFHPAGETHENHWHQAGGRCFHIEITPSMLARIRQHTPVLDGPADFHGGLPAGVAARLYGEFHRSDEVSPLAMEGLALELLAEVSRRPVPVAERAPPRWLRQARDLLHARFAGSPSLDEIAAAVGVHPAHLARVFRRQYGCTMGDYLRQLRVQFACRRLVAADAPLVEIALAAGFVDQSHFTRTFKYHVGMTPAEFQRQFRARNSDTTE
jgi:AraC family transcriptional regulator